MDIAKHITLTTDFGEESHYVAAMKGVILSIHPQVQLIDLTHQIAPQDLQQTAYFLQHSLSYFPPETIHVIVVDPGVGTERSALCVELGPLKMVVPDNGCWTWLTSLSQEKPVVTQLTNSNFWRSEISHTFHGRDIFAPVAAHWSLGITPSEMGTETDQWQSLPYPVPSISGKEILGKVIAIDHFGNLITNIPSEALQGYARESLKVMIGDRVISQILQTYGQASSGEVIALTSSGGLLEIAQVQGNASTYLKLLIGNAVRVVVQSDYNE